MYSPEQLRHIAEQFDICGEIQEVKPLGPGFINDTLIVETSSDRYILQRKNHHVFPDVPGMMNNIDLLTEHIRNKITAENGDPVRGTLTLCKRKSLSESELSLPYSKLYYKDGENFWTMCLFIKDSVTYTKADSPELAYKGGKGLGHFHTQLADFHTPLCETIKGFHDFPSRYAQWRGSVERDAAGRVKDLAEEISWVESRVPDMKAYWTLIENGTIPVRVSHNDTKISNILFDKDGETLAVIDLDTCMSTTVLNDYGDAIRTYTNTGEEDDRNLDNVSMSFEMCKAYTEGYLSEMGGILTETELEHLPDGARYIVYEQMLRFLMDYIDGDTYYKTNAPDHNLVRTRAQHKLLVSIEEQFDKMKELIASFK